MKRQRKIGWGVILERNMEGYIGNAMHLILFISLFSSHLDPSFCRKPHLKVTFRGTPLCGQARPAASAWLRFKVPTYYCGIFSPRSSSTGKTALHWWSRQGLTRSFALFFLISFFSSTSTHYQEEPPTNKKGSLKKHLLTTKYCPSLRFFFNPLADAARRSAHLSVHRARHPYTPFKAYSYHVLATLLCGFLATSGVSRLLSLYSLFKKVATLSIFYQFASYATATISTTRISRQFFISWQ